MTSGDFEHRNEVRWAEYERLIVLMEKGKPGWRLSNCRACSVS